jgi:hypothetical protein
MATGIVRARVAEPQQAHQQSTRLYSITVFVGAFLLFQVQLILAKGILPWFGGTPSVWTTCMLVFQCLLLAGYAYSHLLVNRLSNSLRSKVHILLIGLSVGWIVVLAILVRSPLLVGGAWKPPSAVLSVFRIVGVLGTGVAIPFFVLSTTGPLVQRWYATHSGSPYRLYALSNVGSLLGLLTYPVIVEPMLGLHSQAWLWGAFFVAYAVCCTMCALKANAQSTDANRQTPSVSKSETIPTIGHYLLWIGLPACASLMLLAATNLMSQEIAVVPFLWALPLAVYLLSFVLTFDSPKWYRREIFQPLFVIAALVTTFVVLARRDVGIMNQINAYTLALFATCMVCHGEVSRLKPATRHLTSFYLMLAVGGALGGAVAAVIAPLFFRGYWELQIAFTATALLGLAVLALEPHANWKARSKPVPYVIFAGLIALRFVPGLADSPELQPVLGGWGYLVFLGAAGLTLVATRLKGGTVGAARAMGVSLVLLLVVLMAKSASHHQRGVISAHRNFFGLISVVRSDAADSIGLRHGQTLHGSQYQDEARRDEPTIYYARNTGIGLLLQNFPRVDVSGAPKPLRIGVIGLGIGTLAAYGHKGDLFRFYEIDPDVERLATGTTAPFTFTRDSAATIEVALGDGRLSLEKEDPQKFDVLVIDAFSSGSIPVHLLTREAMRIYERHLASAQSVLAFHVSNRALDLRPVLVGLANSNNLQLLHVLRDGADWVLMARDPRVLQNPAIAEYGTLITLNQDPPLWTDDYTNLLQVLK